MSEATANARQPPSPLIDERPAKKFRHLLNERPETASKPQMDDDLLKFFTALEGLVTFYTGRNQASQLVFDRLQQSLTNTTGRQVSVKQLQQVLAIWPQAYELHDVSTGGKQHSHCIEWPNNEPHDSDTQSSYSQSVYIVQEAVVRRKTFSNKLKAWRSEHSADENLPLADLPGLSQIAK